MFSKQGLDWSNTSRHFVNVFQNTLLFNDFAIHCDHKYRFCTITTKRSINCTRRSIKHLFNKSVYFNCLELQSLLVALFLICWYRHLQWLHENPCLCIFLAEYSFPIQTYSRNHQTSKSRLDIKSRRNEKEDDIDLWHNLLFFPYFYH